MKNQVRTNTINAQNRFTRIATAVCFALTTSYSMLDTSVAASRPGILVPSQPTALTRVPTVTSTKPIRGITGFSTCSVTPFSESIITEHHNLSTDDIYPHQVVALDEQTFIFSEVWNFYDRNARRYKTAQTLNTLALNEDPPILSLHYTEQNHLTPFPAYYNLELGNELFVQTGLSSDDVSEAHLTPSFYLTTAVPRPLNQYEYGVADMDGDENGLHFLKQRKTQWTFSNGVTTEPTEYAVTAMSVNGSDTPVFYYDFFEGIDSEGLPYQTLSSVAEFNGDIYLGSSNNNSYHLLKWSGGSQFQEIVDFNTAGSASFSGAGRTVSDLEAHEQGLVAMQQPRYYAPNGQPFNMNDGTWTRNKLFLINEYGQNCEVLLASNLIDEYSQFTDMDVLTTGVNTIDIILVDSRQKPSHLPPLTRAAGRIVRVSVNLNQAF